MLFSTVLAALASAASVAAQYTGFNYGAQGMAQGDFESRFNDAKNLVGASGFTSARLYTMIQDGTVNTPTSAIQAAIDTGTTLLLGLWASEDQNAFNNELAALANGISQYGTAFTDLIVGISVGSEDLYRITPTGIANNAGYGVGPDVITQYIGEVRNVIANTPAATKPVGHVDTWTAWVNSSNNAVIAACDFLGMDAYPYYQTTMQNDIGSAKNLFFDALSQTQAASQGKPVWVTETGWPLAGPQENQAVASADNSKTYWDEVGCALFGQTNTWWYTLYDGTPSPTFGVVGANLGNTPAFDLTC